MKMTPIEVQRMKVHDAVALYPVTSKKTLEILGYATDGVDHYAFIRFSDTGKCSKLLVRWNQHLEAYISVSLCGKRERVFLSDCRRCVN